VSQATVAINDLGAALRSYCSTDLSKQRLITSQATAAVNVFGHNLIIYSSTETREQPSTSLSQASDVIKQPSRLILEICHQLEEHITLNTAVEQEEVGTVC
jgi:extradiol dioxygenase family protein